MTRQDRRITMSARTTADADIPLVLDVDGTFLRTDLLFECFWGGLSKAPIQTLKTVVKHWRNRAVLKRELAEIAQPRMSLMPINPTMAAEARIALAAGREVVLASASDEHLVEALSAEYGLSPKVFGSDGHTNLKGARKAEALVAAYGVSGFDYAGNAMVDVPIWERARNALVVGSPHGVGAALAGRPGVVHLQGGWKPMSLLRACRPHQWVKNVLLLLPMVAAHQFDLATLFPLLWGMAAFSAAASSIYIINDLLDLEADRLHATKRRRPFASGVVPIPIGMAASLGLGLFAIGVSAVIGPMFLLVVLTYMALSLAYSLSLKRKRWIDIAVLATLYTLRVVAGAATGGVSVSIQMIVFVFPVFLTLGCVKRLTELARAKGDARLPGRGYGRADREDVLNIAWIGVVAALVIFFLYSFSDQARALYPTTWILWAALIPIYVWLVRMVRLGWEGRMDYDPIVFAMRDKAGIGILCFTLSMMFYAAGLWAEWFGL